MAQSRGKRRQEDWKLAPDIPTERCVCSSSSSKLHKLPGKIHLIDLCSEDKARIGDLLRRLVEEKSQRLAVISEQELEKTRYEAEIRRLQQENQTLVAELARIKRGQGSPKAMKAEESTISLSETPQQSITFRSPDRGTQMYLKSIGTSPFREEGELRVSQSTGTQTTLDKGMQADTPMVSPRHITTPSHTSSLHSHSKPSAEIKTLRQDIATLSMSLRNFGESVPATSRGGKHFRFDAPLVTASPVIKTGFNPLVTPSQGRKTEEDQGTTGHFDIFSPRDVALKPSKLTLNIPRSPIPELGPTGLLNESQSIDYNDDLFSMIEDLERKGTTGDVNHSRVVELIEEMEKQTGRKG